ncbi:nucleotidyltransferase family protein [Chrysiogenes arsenatis]|uniref:nucleotidyltransferase family protein n=1 Tax=Chrysiogenes arsenatis TaxID=309797 RepID=UPI000481A647|nr:nucleotidyltransferase family protein [Chrysiogenes arsenatis]
MKNNIDHLRITPNASMHYALQVIDKGAVQIALVVDEVGKLLGTLTDGDIRRGLLKGLSLESSVESIYYRTPTVAMVTDTNEAILQIALRKKLHQIPIINEEGKVVALREIDDLVQPSQKSNKVVLMAGGLGKRLGDLTRNTPKPMLNVGNKPILQTIIESFSKSGYTSIVLSVNYLSHKIENYFGDGSNFGVTIEYVHETERMGTAGALSLMRNMLSEPFFVMNADLLTNVDFEKLHQFHIMQNPVATMAVREYDFQVPYGVVNIEDDRVTSIIEKPVHKFFVSAGIYMLSPAVLEYVPDGHFFDMPSLFDKLIQEGQYASSFPIHEYWLDIGRMSDFERANDEFNGVF